MNFKILVKPSLVIITIHLVCLNHAPGQKRNYAFSIYDSYGQALLHEPLPRAHAIYNFDRPFLDHHYFMHLVCLIFALE